MTSKDAVWITGVGTANPLGTTYETTADQMLAGASGIQAVTAFALPAHLSRIAGQIGPIPVPPSWDAAAFARLARLDQVLLWSSEQALRSAGLWEQRADLRVGLTLGLGAGMLLVWEQDHKHGGRRIYEPERDEEAFVDVLQRRLGLIGPMATCGAACASANFALALGRRWVQMGWVDVCLAGGAETGVTPMCLSGFGNLRALSKRNNDPQAASRPFDRERDGFVMGEGGAFFVLESAAHARRRGACAHAEIAGFGASSDAYHMVIPSSDPQSAIAAMRSALADAAINPDEVDYVNAHATSTPVGDVAETRVLQAVFGDNLKKVPVSSIKSMIGHLLSGAAAINALACVVALERQALPPTVNLDDPDPACNLCHIPHQARPHRTRLTVSNSLGFGGSNTCIVLRKVA